jgi:hypothetical protein
VPGIDYEDDVFCAWVDRNGDIPTTGFQVHWPEFDRDRADMRDLNYYCREDPPVFFHESYEPSHVNYWQYAKRHSPNPRDAKAPAIFNARSIQQSSAEKGRRAANAFANDPRIIKSYYPKHTASELCDRSKKAAGQSFVSYAEEKFCYMPTKTLYPFCTSIDDGACWDDAENIVITKGQVNAESRPFVPDLSHINETIVWGKQ